MYERYQERGFEVLAFPANDFGQQEPGTNQEIKGFVAILEGYEKSSISSIELEKMTQAIDELSLQERKDQLAGSLSGGWKERVFSSPWVQRKFSALVKIFVQV